MKCQKCGANMVSGHLYCDICGAEYQIVPDFEPELENSMAKSLSDISDTIREKNTTEKMIFHRNNTTKKVPSFLVIFTVVFICSVFVFLGYSKYTHSTTYQNNLAIEAADNKDYYTAAEIYEKIRKKNPNDAYWYIQKAKMNLAMGDDLAAYNLATTAITLDTNTDIAYAFLLSYLKDHENYIELVQYLKICNIDSLKDEYREYLATVPIPNYDSGSYDKSLEISFGTDYQGTIYYTLDGTIPTTESTVYQAPIKLGNGNHQLSVIYENELSLLGDPVVYEYHITSDIPMSPVVNPTSGKYTQGSMIVVDIEEGTRVFYTTDLSKPTLESEEYTAPIPMPLGESRYNFIAYSNQGIPGSVTQRNYMLNMKTALSIEDAEIKLIQKLISIGHILDQNGAVSGRYGVFRYFYKFPISEETNNYYVFEEHYMENQINNPLQHFYAVDVLYGNVYKLLSDGEGNYTRIDL